MRKKRKKQYWHALTLVGGPLDGDQWEVPEQEVLDVTEICVEDLDSDRILHWYEIHAAIGTATFLRTEGRIE